MNLYFWLIFIANRTNFLSCVEKSSFIFFFFTDCEFLIFANYLLVALPCGSFECHIFVHAAACCVVRRAVCPSDERVAHAGHASWREVDLHGWRSTLDSYPLHRFSMKSLHYKRTLALHSAFCALTVRRRRWNAR